MAPWKTAENRSPTRRGSSHVIPRPHQAGLPRSNRKAGTTSVPGLRSLFRQQQRRILIKELVTNFGRGIAERLREETLGFLTAFEMRIVGRISEHVGKAGP